MLPAGRLSGFLLSSGRNPRVGASIAVLAECSPTIRLLRSRIHPGQTASYFSNFGRHDADIRLGLRSGTTTPSGAILPEPKRTRFGLLSVVTAVVTGLLIGATLSKLMANFLEEKELFVPSDDDDDDDDDD